MLFLSYGANNKKVNEEILEYACKERYTHIVRLCTMCGIRIPESKQGDYKKLIESIIWSYNNHDEWPIFFKKKVLMLHLCLKNLTHHNMLEILIKKIA